MELGHGAGIGSVGADLLHGPMGCCRGLGDTGS